MKLIIETNLKDKFKVPLLKELAKEPLIVDDVMSFKVVGGKRNSGDPKDHFCLKSLPNGKACMKKGFHYVTTSSKLGDLSTVFCKQHYEESEGK